MEKVKISLRDINSKNTNWTELVQNRIL